MLLIDSKNRVYRIEAHTTTRSGKRSRDISFAVAQIMHSEGIITPTMCIDNGDGIMIVDDIKPVLNRFTLWHIGKGVFELTDLEIKRDVKLSTLKERE